MHHVILAIGSNIGDKKHNIYTALDNINAFANIMAISRLYHTRPQGLADYSPDIFYNAAIYIQTTLDPIALIQHTQNIEYTMGRHIRPHEKISRIIDIDIIFFDDIKAEYENISIPHPRYANRDYVVYPIADIMAQYPYALDIQLIEKDSIIFDEEYQYDAYDSHHDKRVSP